MTYNHFDVQAVRQDFPILARKVHGRPLVYLDNAATTQKPHAVIEAVSQYYKSYNANVHRGLHALSEEATAAMETARGRVRRFLNAANDRTIVFTKGTTESLNLLASVFGQSYVGEGDEIIITHMEHHSNIVPWQLLCERVGATLKVVPVNDEGVLELDAYENLFTAKTRLVSVVHVSNTLGTLNPVKQMVQMAHARGVPVILDGAQAVSHVPVDVQELDCDFYAFSGHKLFAPTGIGVLYGKEHWLEQLPPYQGGGDMIRTVRFSGSTYADLPHKFEAGTPPIAGAIGLGNAIEYFNQFSYADIQAHESALLKLAQERLSQMPDIRVLGQAPLKCSVISLYCEQVHPHDLSTLLDFEGVAIRAGHHCNMPLMERFELPATVRASFAFYNTLEEVNVFFDALTQVRRSFQ